MNTDSKYYDYHFVSYVPNPVVAQLTLGEGKTPLTIAERLAAECGLEHVYIKHEERNPTGSFKDRESMVAIGLAKQRGLTTIQIASSGNAALSMAAYARKAGIVCECFVPITTSKKKKELIVFFGGILHELDGNYEQVYRYVADHYDVQTNMTSGICAERTEGTKEIAKEIWQEIGVPDVVVVPCGNGGNLAGIWKGFAELLEQQQIMIMPKLIGVQVAGAAPLKLTHELHQQFVVHPNTVDSIAEGILAEESYCSPKVMTALQSTNGAILEVSESQIKEALKQVIATESLMIEPTAAAAFAALPMLHKIGVASEAKVVVISTGSGMKMLEEIRSLI